MQPQLSLCHENRDTWTAFQVASSFFRTLLGYSQVPDEGVVGFQLSHTIVESIHWCSGQSQAQFVHDIGVGLVICKKWNHPQQRLNFYADPLEFLFFLAQDATGIFHFTLRNMQHGKV